MFDVSKSFTFRKAHIRITDAHYTADPELPTLNEFADLNNGDVIVAEVRNDGIAWAEHPTEGSYAISEKEYKVEAYLP